jgi:hypothetical protein
VSPIVDYREFDRGDGVWEIFAVSTRTALSTFESKHPKLKIRIERIEPEIVRQGNETLVIQSLILVTTDRTQ